MVRRLRSLRSVVGKLKTQESQWCKLKSEAESKGRRRLMTPLDYPHPSSKTTSSLVTKMIKDLPAMQETQVQSLGWVVPLEKGMATHSSILAWRISWTEEPGESHGQRSLEVCSPQGCRADETTNTHTQLEANQRERSNDPFLSLSVPCQPPVDWMILPTVGRAICFVQFINSNTNFFWKVLHRHTQKSRFNQISGYPDSQST